MRPRCPDCTIAERGNSRIASVDVRYGRTDHLVRDAGDFVDQPLLWRLVSPS